jgi:hypothetical protein
MNDIIVLNADIRGTIHIATGRGFMIENNVFDLDGDLEPARRLTIGSVSMDLPKREKDSIKR